MAGQEGGAHMQRARIHGPHALVRGHDDGAAIAQKRHAAHEKLLEAARSQRFYLFLIDLVRWIEDGNWLKVKSKQGDRPVARFARTAIARRRKRLLKRADHLKKLAPQARHQVRIDGKKLRYMTEFLQPLAKSKEQRRAVTRSYV